MMAVFRWGESWFNYRELEREVDRLLHEVGFSVRGLQFDRRFPALNLYELEEEFLLTAELPGVESADVDLTIEHGVLTLRGKRDTAGDVPEEKFRRRERFSGAWSRSVTLPDRIDLEHLRAEFQSGVLLVHLPKQSDAAPRKIPVTDGGSNDE